MATPSSLTLVDQFRARAQNWLDNGSTNLRQSANNNVTILVHQASAQPYSFLVPLAFINRPSDDWRAMLQAQVQQGSPSFTINFYEKDNESTSVVIFAMGILAHAETPATDPNNQRPTLPPGWLHDQDAMTMVIHSVGLLVKYHCAAAARCVVRIIMEELEHNRTAGNTPTGTRIRLAPWIPGYLLDVFPINQFSPLDSAMYRSMRIVALREIYHVADELRDPRRGQLTTYNQAQIDTFDHLTRIFSFINAENRTDILHRVATNPLLEFMPDATLAQIHSSFPPLDNIAGRFNMRFGPRINGARRLSKFQTTRDITVTARRSPRHFNADTLFIQSNWEENLSLIKVLASNGPLKLASDAYPVFAQVPQWIQDPVWLAKDPATHAALATQRAAVRDTYIGVMGAGSIALLFSTCWSMVPRNHFPLTDTDVAFAYAIEMDPSDHARLRNDDNRRWIWSKNNNGQDFWTLAP